MPTTMVLVAQLSSVDTRARYMSLYSLTMGAAKGIGPVIGGLLNDNISPVAIWYGGAVMGVLSACVFLILHRQQIHTKSREIAPGTYP